MDNYTNVNYRQTGQYASQWAILRLLSTYLMALVNPNKNAFILCLADVIAAREQTELLTATLTAGFQQKNDLLHW